MGDCQYLGFVFVNLIVQNVGEPLCSDPSERTPKCRPTVGVFRYLANRFVDFFFEGLGEFQRDFSVFVEGIQVLARGQPVKVHRGSGHEIT
jgi:hypothetical protein